jgi:hypothetical protein
MVPFALLPRIVPPTLPACRPPSHHPGCTPIRASSYPIGQLPNTAYHLYTAPGTTTPPPLNTNAMGKEYEIPNEPVPALPGYVGACAALREAPVARQLTSSQAT